nr:IPT/TIG domain-containing protein [Bacillota bacterium]
MKRFISFFLVFILVFSMPINTVKVSAAEVLTITYEVNNMDKEEQPGSPIKEGERLVIGGEGFENPTVRAGVSGAVRLNISPESNEYEIIIDAKSELDKIRGLKNKIRVFNQGGTVDLTGAGIEFNLESIPSVRSVSKDKAYVGDTLDISGTVFENLDTDNDNIFVSGRSYSLSMGNDGNDLTADIMSDSRIVINKLKSPNDTGLSHVSIVRNLDGDSRYQIISQLRNSIMVVNELKGITFSRIDPNSGPKGRANNVGIYVSEGGSELTPNMRIFVQTIDAQYSLKEKEGTNLGTIQSGSDVIGLRALLPESWTDTGIVDIVLTTPDRGSEIVYKNAFIYLDIGNTLSIDPDGVIPNFKKETEQKNISIEGRNIGYFSALGYDKIINVVYDGIIGYSKYLDFTELSDVSSYKVKYNGVYDIAGDGYTPGVDPDITIIREIRIYISGEARIQEDPANKFAVRKDIIIVKPPVVNLPVKEPTKVDLTIRTTTTIFKEINPSTMEEYYSRSEEAVLIRGFTYYPDVTAPFFNIDGITPRYGPNNKIIYMTIKGKDFEVKEDGTKPTVTIGERVIAEDPDTPEQEIMVFDDNNKVVDGKIIKSGTKIKFKLPVKADGASGGADVKVTNPSEGQFTVNNGFEFRNPSREDEKMPKINELKEAYADMRGGVISGETVTITGENFDTSADLTPRIYVTIDGEKATVSGKVSSDGKAVIIIPPPGTLPGATKLQLINEDGSMAEADFEYKRITSNPKISKIIPVKGGEGTKLIIKGEDFVFPDSTVEYNDPRRKGSVVILGGMELNAYKYNDLGQITDNGTGNIYYEDDFDPDGDPLTPDSYFLYGHMIEVQDLTTIYVDIPDRFYSFAGGASSFPYLKWKQIPLGSLKVEVLNPDGAKSKEDIRFDFMRPATHPVISSISPNGGSVDGGTVVTIMGSDFVKNGLEIYFGSEKCQQVDFINSTMIRALVPRYPYPLPAGKDELLVPVMAVNFDGGTAVYYDKIGGTGFKYRIPGSNPVINSIDPNRASAAGGEYVILNGQDFRRDPEDMTESGYPKVYFKGKAAKVEWFDPVKISSNSLRVKVPSSQVKGPVDVILINYDSGTCTYKGFSYVQFQPRITSVMPNSISKFGSINMQINGNGFRSGGTEELFISAQEKVNRHLGPGTNAANSIGILSAFGDESTGDKKTIDTVIGPTFAVMSELRVDCTVTYAVYEQVNVRISLTSDDTHSVIQRYRMDIDGNPEPDSSAEADIIVGSSHLFIINHKMDLGSTESYDEGILVETTPSSVTVTRRIAPYAKVLDEGNQVDVKSPPINKLGVRNLRVINDDNGIAVSSITVLNPDSSPVITSIDPKNKAKRFADNQIVDYVPENIADYSELYTFVPLDGGAFLTIKGSDFRRNVKVYLNDKPLEIVTKSTNDDQLIVKVPKGTAADSDKDYRIVVVNEDGGTFDSTMLERPHYIRYRTPDSSPVITAIIPDKSSSRGTNAVKITGRNFWAGVKVLIDGMECVTTRAGEGDYTGDKSPSYENIYAAVPPGMTPGKKTVQVQNTDFGIAEVRDGLTIISSPEITRIIGPKGVELNPLVLSVEGGERIRIEGIQFYPGARVIFGATLKAASELSQGETGIHCLNINNAEMVVIGGTPAEGKLEEDGSITCTTPRIPMGATSVLVLNSDGGVSNLISGSYEKPVPEIPEGMTLEAVDGDTLKLEWKKLEGIMYYEIYISESDD